MVSVIVLSVVMLSVVMLSVVMLSVIMLIVVRLNVVMLSVVEPFKIILSVDDSCWKTLYDSSCIKLVRLSLPFTSIINKHF